MQHFTYNSHTNWSIAILGVFLPRDSRKGFMYRFPYFYVGLVQRDKDVNLCRACIFIR